ncbi:MAG TPA: hypothetical protein VFE55_03195 [Acidimicrobiia bacterium]|nr:hypothetical protein [Acidimicrobiia bacterium]
MGPSRSALRRATSSVLVAVALIGGSILLLGDRFGAAGGGDLAQPVHVEARIAACVADESMRLIDTDRERCHADERELASERGERPARAGTRSTEAAVSGYETVTSQFTMAGRGTGSGEARCPAEKVAVGGGVRPDPDAPRKAGATDPAARMEIVASGPRPGDAAGGSGWTAAVRNTATAPLAVIVAVICVAAR